MPATTTAPATQAQAVLTELIESLRGRHHLRVVTTDGNVVIGKLLAAKPSDSDDLLRLREVDSGQERTVSLAAVTHAMWTDHVPF